MMSLFISEANEIFFVGKNWRGNNTKSSKITVVRKNGQEVYSST